LPETHDNEDAVVGFPYTRNVEAPFMMLTPPTSALIKNEVEKTIGTVEKVKVDPPFDDAIEIAVALVEDTEKSEALRW